MAINGSPRKDGNTATMLKNALEGAASQGADTEFVHIYDLDFKGCVSCLACKLNNAKSTGCVQRDELTPVLDKILQDVDVLLLGSPVYFTSMSAGMRAFYERAAYPYLPTNEQGSKFPKKIKVGLILTIGANEKLIYDMGMNKHFELTEMMMGFIFGSAESLIVTEASLTQDGDYAKYGFSSEIAAEAKLRNEERFPIACKKGFDMGVRLAKN